MSKTTRYAIIAAVVLAAVVVIAFKEGGAGDRPEAPNTTSGPAATGALGPELSPEDGTPHLIDLGAASCIPCKMMAPILEDLKSEYEGVLQVTFIDVSKNAAAARRYNIRAIPTQIFLSPGGRELDRHEGFMSREAILDKWRELGFDLSPRPAPAGSGGTD